MESCLLSLIDMLIVNILDLYTEDTTQEDKTDPNCSGSGQDQPRYNCRFTRYQQININYGYGRSNYSYESQQNYLTHRIGIKIKISFLLQKKKHSRWYVYLKEVLMICLNLLYMTNAGWRGGPVDPINPGLRSTMYQQYQI